MWLSGTPARWSRRHPCLCRCRHLHPCHGRGEVCRLAAAWRCRGVPPAGALRTGSSSTSLGLLLVASLVFGLLQLNELLDLLAALEVMAFGAVDLAVLLVGVVLLVGGRHSLAVGACGNLLAGATSLCYLGATFVAGLLDN